MNIGESFTQSILAVSLVFFSSFGISTFAWGNVNDSVAGLGRLGNYTSPHRAQLETLIGKAIKNKKKVLIAVSVMRFSPTAGVIKEIDQAMSDRHSKLGRLLESYEYMKFDGTNGGGGPNFFFDFLPYYRPLPDGIFIYDPVRNVWNFSGGFSSVTQLLEEYQTQGSLSKNSREKALELLNHPSFETEVEFNEEREEHGAILMRAIESSAYDATASESNEFYNLLDEMMAKYPNNFHPLVLMPLSIARGVRYLRGHLTDDALEGTGPLRENNETHQDWQNIDLNSRWFNLFFVKLASTMMGDAYQSTYSHCLKLKEDLATKFAKLFEPYLESLKVEHEADRSTALEIEDEQARLKKLAELSEVFKHKSSQLNLILNLNELTCKTIGELNGDIP